MSSSPPPTEQDPKAEPRSAKKRRGGFLRFLFLLALTGALAAGGALYYGYHQFKAPGPLDEERIVLIERGSSVTAIAKTLAAEGVISDPLIFRLGARATEQATRLRAGEYRFPAKVSMEEAMRILVEGEAVDYAITLPEGLTSIEMIDLIKDDPVLTGEVEAIPPEGALLPETYHFVRGDSRQDIIERMTKAMDDALGELWASRQEGLPLDSPREALILASIVQKETGLADELPLVASVFINRLNRPMRLQSDPTVIYAITKGETPLGRALTRADLQLEDPYNTYTSDGLPPGPIANPGRAALEAVLNPPESEYYYFVANGDGGHAFARTLAEHNANVAKWRRIQNSQN